MALYFKVDTSLGLSTQVFSDNSTTVDWGDGSPLSSGSGMFYHTYVSSNIYTVTLTPNNGIFYFFNPTIEITCTSNNVKRIVNFGNTLTGLTINNCVNLLILESTSTTNLYLSPSFDLSTSTSLNGVSLTGLMTDLEISNSNITGISLQGYFNTLILTGCTNLRSLSLYSSPNIKDLDLSTLSLVYGLNLSNLLSLSGCTFPNPWTPPPSSYNNIQIYNNDKIKNLNLNGLTYTLGGISLYITNNNGLETLLISNFKTYQFTCQSNNNLKSIMVSGLDADYFYIQSNNNLESLTFSNLLINYQSNTYDNYSLKSIIGDLIPSSTPFYIYNCTLLETFDVSNYSGNYININNSNLNYLNLPNNNILEYNIPNNNISSYNYINFSTVERIYLNNNSIGSSVFTSLLEAGYLSGAVNVFLDIQEQEPNFNPSQNALSFINLLTNTRGWTILYTPDTFPTYAGQLDTTFNEGNYGPYDMVFIIKKQTDGKILIGGRFENYNNEDAGYIKRLNPDGTIDNTFFSGYTFDDVVQAIELQGDKILVGGVFQYYDPQDSNIQTRYMARLNSDGTLDGTFPTGNTFNGQVRVITLQPDGKILVGGNFSGYNDGTGNVASRGLIRLNSDGTVDTSFNVGTGFENNQNGNVYSIIVQDDGKIVVGGWFTVYNGNTAERIVRLNPDGSNDFTMGDPGFNNRVSRIIQQPDGKFLCVGWFSEYSGNSYNHIIRFNTDGTVDTTFQDNNIDWGYIQAIEILDTGKILIGGYYDSGYVNFNMLNSDGSISDDLNIVGGFNGQVNYILQQDHYKVLVGGWFNQYQGYDVNYLARLWLYDPFNIPISAGTEVFICDIDCSGGTVTTSVEHPYWTNLYGQAVIQQDAIALGGNNGYNS